MYTPITKRVKVAQHKSSVAKQKDDKKKVTETATTQNEQGYETETTGTGTPGSKKTILYTDLPEDQREAAKKYNLETYGTLDPTKKGLADNTITTDPEASFKSTPKTQEAQRGSSIDLMGPQELRGNTRAGKIAARNVKKASKQLKRMQKKFDAGKINQETLDAYKDELKNTVARSKNIGQQATGMRNRYITQRMEYDRKLKGAQDAGPVKAPEGTQTEEEFKSKFKKDLGVNGGSSDPQTTTTPTTSFTEMATMAFKPIKLGGDALFTGNLFDKGQKKSPAFKMKGYGSKK
jgi:hypothetical protein